MKTKILLTLTCLFWQILAWGQMPVTIKTSEGKNLMRISNYTVTPNALLFYATTGDRTREGIWKTDGTDQGTTLLIEQYSSYNYGTIWNSITYNGYVYFLTYSKATPNLNQIWRSNGTDSGTGIFFQLAGGISPNSIDDFQSIVFKNELYFAIKNRISGKYSLHKTDGKTTTLIKSEFSGISQLVESGGYICFSSDKQLWRTDGTESGTKVIPTPSGIDITLAGALPNGCIYNANYYINSVNTFGLYITDVNGKTSLLGEGAARAGRFYAYFGTTIGNKMYFFNSDDDNSNIWVTNGTKEGTKKLIDRNNVTKIGSDLYKYQDNIYFFGGRDGKKGNVYKIDTSTDTYSNFFASSTSEMYFNFIGNYFYVQTSVPSMVYTDGNKWGDIPFTTYTSKLGEFRNEVYVEYLRSPVAASEDINLVKVKVKNPNPDCDNFNTNLKSTDGQTTLACNGNLDLSIGTSGGTAPFTYQWSYEGAIIDGANGATFPANKAGSYVVTIKDTKGCSSTSNRLVLTSNSPTIAIAGNSSICPTETTTLTANATGGVSPYTYQWKQNSTNVGTNTTTYAASTAGSYSVGVTDSKGCTGTSAAYSVTQKPSPNVTVSTSRTPALLTGESVVLSVPTASGQTYQWAKDGTAISGATNNSYTVSGAGSYTVTVIGGGCTATSSAVMVSIILANEPLEEELGLRVSPNPTVNQAKIVLQLAQSAAANVYVLDASGRRVRTWESAGKANRHEVMLDMRSVAAGSYVVQAEAEGQVFTEKLVKQ